MKELFKENEILYISTDEKNKSFFEPFREAGHQIFFLEDFEQITTSTIYDDNQMGMLETVVASQGRVFVGTFRSTFSGYINRCVIKFQQHSHFLVFFYSHDSYVICLKAERLLWH